MATYLSQYIPKPVLDTLALFPLKEFDQDWTPESKVTAQGTLYASHALDPQAQCVASLGRLLGLRLDYTVSGNAGDPTLPYLVLQGGHFVPSASLVSAIIKLAPESTLEEQDAFTKAYEALVKSTLFPAVLAHLYLTPQKTSSSKPLLRELLDRTIQKQREQSTIDDILRIRKLPSESPLDLDALTAEALECLDSLEVALARQSGPYFSGQKPTTLDAWVLALLYVASESHFSVISDRLKTLTALSGWYDRHTSA